MRIAIWYCYMLIALCSTNTQARRRLPAYGKRTVQSGGRTLLWERLITLTRRQHGEPFSWLTRMLKTRLRTLLGIARILASYYLTCTIHYRALNTSSCPKPAVFCRE